jgi:hypothetical protein
MPRVGKATATDTRTRQLTIGGYAAISARSVSDYRRIEVITRVVRWVD